MARFSPEASTCFLLLLHIIKCVAQDRCALWHHSGMLRTPSLYIDGGVELRRANGTTTIGFNNYILEIGLGDSWNADTNFTEFIEAKFGSSDADFNPPAMVRGTLYRGPLNDSKLYTYGGSTFLANTSAPDWHAPSDNTYSVWSFDTVASVWDRYNITDAVPVRPNWGANTEDSAAGYAFSLNGQVDRGTSDFTYQEVEYVGNEPTSTGNETTYLGGLVVFNLNNHTAWNRSSDSLGQPRVGGGMIYVDDLGAEGNGILLALGGMYSSGAGSDTFTNGVLVDFTSVALTDSYLQENVTWHNQTTSGQIPPPRIDFCLLPSVEAPADNSSRNIYIYGGFDPSQSKIYDDIWVLSLPSFTWTQVYSDAVPRFGHTCNRAGLRQMVVLGGAFDASLWAVETTGILPDLNNVTCDPTGGVTLFDVSSLTWSSSYDAYAAPYEVPQKIVSAIGGSAKGGATITQPVGGFTDPTISAMFTPAPASTSSASNTKTSAGTIAGGVVGSIAGLAIIIGIVIWILRRRARNKADTSNNHHELPEMGVGYNVLEVSGDAERKELPAVFEGLTVESKEKPYELSSERSEMVQLKPPQEPGEVAELPGWHSP